MARAGCLSDVVLLRDLWKFSEAFHDTTDYRMSNYKEGQNCMAFCVTLGTFMDKTAAVTFQKEDAYSVTLLDSAQQERGSKHTRGSNGCGVAVIQQLYCECFGRLRRIDSRNLSGDCEYRFNIRLAIQRNDVHLLDLSYIPTDAEKQGSLLPAASYPHVHLTILDWNSLAEQTFVSDGVVKACSTIMQKAISERVDKGTCNTGTVYIVDTLFATMVLDNCDNAKKSLHLHQARDVSLSEGHDSRQPQQALVLVRVLATSIPEPLVVTNGLSSA